MREVAFGQFYPKESFIHSLDPRTKIVLSILYIVGIFMAKTIPGFIVSFVFLAFVILLSRLPLRVVFKSIKPILFLVVFTSLLNLFFFQEGEVIFQLWFIKIKDAAVEFSILMAVRLIMLVMGTSILTLTTQPVALTDGIESLLSPLKIIRFPVHELALIMSIALRFIPTLMDETDRIIRAQTARGASFDDGGILAKAKAMIPILIPLLVSSFRRADELADAMDARCYSGGKNRTKMKKLTFTFNDFLSIVFSLSFILILIATNALW